MAAPDSPFRLNRTRIVIVGLVLLAVVSIIGAVSGGLSGYQDLREAATAPATTPTPSSPY